MRKKLISTILFILIVFSSTQVLGAQSFFYHTVTYGDTFWKLSKKYGVDLKNLMEINNADEGTILYVGQKIKIPAQNKGISEGFYLVQQGDTFWKLSQKFRVPIKTLMEVNGAGVNTILYPGQRLKIPRGEEPWVTYRTHTVVRGDDLWKLGIQYGVPMYEIMKLNGLKENSVLYPGQKLTIPVHHVPEKPTPGPQYGEYLDWWTEAQYVWPLGTDAVIKDFETGVTWRVRRTLGANHADVEPLTWQDSMTMKRLWGGWSWRTRPVIVIVNGRRLAASASAMPHDIQYINDNGFNGHFDVHFRNSTRHKDGKISEAHQEAVREAAGY